MRDFLGQEANYAREYLVAAGVGLDRQELSFAADRREVLLHVDGKPAFVWPIRAATRSRALVPLLLLAHVVVCCVSFYFVQQYYGYMKGIRFDPDLIGAAIVSLLPFFALGFFLVRARRASFGYGLSFYFFSMIVGYAWLSSFSDFQYNKGVAAVSIFLSAVAFFIPAIFVMPRMPRPIELSRLDLSRLLFGILAFAGIILALSSGYHFQVVGLGEIYSHRDQIEIPGILRYGIGISTGALLPFALTLSIFQGRLFVGLLASVLLVLFYPVTLLKLALFAPAWVVFLALLSRFAEARVMVILSLLLPALAGLLVALMGLAMDVPFDGTSGIRRLFDLVNFRMLAIPAVSFDMYSDFFSRNPLTYFCQISWLKPVVSCPYAKPLSVVLNGAYGIGR